ncbi:DENN domain-containing protein 2A-like [Gouania willdenowi]|uniref:DENN domain-containing protein 2A-like n=1 Tax=Gouania willdenowi TaxID=441366 RepID=A0A8C5HVV8_GOUWI|nr:DENN domain-containing protein 2A-like [Gouania willdenowi]
MDTWKLCDGGRCPLIMEATRRMRTEPECIYATVNRKKKSDLQKQSPFKSKEKGLKLPFVPLENLSTNKNKASVMAHRLLNIDRHSNDSSVTVGTKLVRSSGSKIKEKISLWEGKEPTSSPSTSDSLRQCANEKTSESLSKSKGKPTENRPCLLNEPVKEREGSTSRVEQSISHGEKNSRKVVDCIQNQDNEKENVEEIRLCSPSMTNNQKVGTLRKSIERRTTTQQSQEKKAVFTLFKKLEAMGENYGRQSQELGNYFSPPNKDKHVEMRKQESDTMGQSNVSSSCGTKEWTRHLENAYTEPGTAPINPVPKPRRTFQHPAFFSKSQRLGRGQRNLPPLPSTSSNTSLKPPSGVYGRSKGERVGDNFKRRSFEYEDLAESNRLLITRTQSQEHHYEDIQDPFKENPYEDVELESLSSQQSLPSSPGADTSKGSQTGFFRQNSGRSFKLLDLRRANQQTHSPSGGGVSPPIQLSPPSTPSRPDQTSWISGDPYSRTCRRIPTVVLRINSIFETPYRKKHFRGLYRYAETSSGRVTDDNTDSESEFEERAKAHHQRLSTVKSILSRPNQNQARLNGANNRKISLAQELHQRKLFEYFLVVSLQRSKTGAHYLPEVTQQFPPKLERGFKFMRETEDQLRIIPQFCFPDAKDWKPVETYPSEMFSFVLTGEDGSRRFGYCRRLLPSGKGKRLPEVYCIVSHLGCFNLFSKVLDEVERRRALSPALVQPFMRAIMEAQFPAPGRTINIKTFLPGSGTEVMELCRPSDSRLEHVNFECLFSCLSLRLLLGVFSSLLLERRVIFTADKLSTLSQCCHAVVALLYPFVWQHTYIPVLPSAMLDIVCTPTPFIVGLLSSSLSQLTELPLEEVLVVDLGNNRFLKQLDDEDSILPSKLQSALENILERRRELANERGADTISESSHLSTVVSEAFVRFFVELVGHYPLFITGEREDGYSSSSSSPGPSSFQHQSFRKAIPSKSVRRFLEVFMETQMFGWFVHERELHRQALRGLFEVRVQEYLDSISENEHRRVNRFLKGLGNKMKFLSKK